MGQPCTARGSSSSAKYTNWYDGEPLDAADTCVGIKVETKWNDAPCNLHLGGVCEANMVSN